MSTARIGSRTIAGGALGTLFLLLVLWPGVARSCVLDNTASLWVDGVRASLNVLPPTDLAHWAPFTLDRAFASGTTIHLHENRADLARTLSPTMLAAPYRWSFGDGTTALGHAVTHRYARAGYYRVAVSGNAGAGRGWAPFDSVLVHIVTPQEAVTANLGYYALRALDLGVPVALWLIEGAVAVAVIYFVFVGPRLRRPTHPELEDQQQPATAEKGTLTHA